MRCEKKRQGGRTVSLSDVIPPRRRGGCGWVFDTAAGVPAAAARDVWHLEHGHGTIEQTVHDLESGRLVAPHRRGVPVVARLTLAPRVLEHDVGRLEDANRQRVRPVLPHRLEQAREERGAHHLELERLGVRDLDRRLAVVGHVEPSKVFFVRALWGAAETSDSERDVSRRWLAGCA